MPKVGQLLGLLLVFASCKSSFIPQKVEYAGYQITATQPKDSSLLYMMKPYGDSVSKSMNVVVGIAEETLEKKQPTGTLNNFMADAMLFAGKQKFGVPVDAAFVNYGGVRANQLAKGEVTRGKVFELMPFDNILVLQKVKGDVLQQFLDHIASLGGWPVAGITMQIANKKAVDVLVNGAPLDVNKMYTIINSDYVANGGDNAAMLKNIPQQNIGYLMRDAIFDYIAALKAQGKNITPQTENRITNAQ